MDNEIKTELLKDLKKAFTIDEKLDIITIFLEHLADASLSNVETSNKFSDFVFNINTLTQEQQKALGYIVDRIENLETQIRSNLENVTSIAQSVTKLYGHVTDLNESQSKILDDINHFYDSNSKILDDISFFYDQIK